MGNNMSRIYTIILLVAIVVLSSCKAPSDRDAFKARRRQHDELIRREFEQRHAKVWAQEIAENLAKWRREAAESLQVAGGYGPAPTTRGRQRARATLKASLKNPRSFELDSESKPEQKSWPVGDGYKHGWALRIHYRATNSYGGVVPGEAIVLIRGDDVIYIGDVK